MGQFDPFPPLRLNGRCQFSLPTFAGASGNDEVAPIPDLPALPQNGDLRPPANLRPRFRDKDIEGEVCSA